jgi:two-component system, OmpR family, response regulator BaeR
MTEPSTTPSILIVEDEAKLASVLADYLHSAGYTTRCIGSGLEAAAAVRSAKPDLILLDLTLPGKDGVEVCGEIRAFSETPIIMVTARVEEVDRLIGLDVGADDYICKPFSPREVVARVRAILRRSRSQSAAVEIPGLMLDEQGQRARFHGQWLDLTAIEFRLLQVLAKAPGRVFSRDQLLNALYPDHRLVADRTVDSHVKNLRRKLNQANSSQELVRSVYGVGYKIDA